MPIVVLEASETDIPRACEIEAAAYANNPANAVLFPGPFPSDSSQKRADRLITEMRNDKSISCLKAIDEETGDLIAFAKWHIFSTPEAATAAEKVLFFGPGTNQEACYAFFGGMAQRKKEIMGDRPHIYLHLLHTDPKNQCHGAGSLLVKWGLQKSDELSLPVYLESSPVAHTFYKKLGFKDLLDFSIDLSHFGAGSKPHITPILIREPAER